MQAIEYTQTRLTQGKVTISPKGYIFKSLEGNYRIGAAEKKMLNAESQRREAAKAQAEIAAAKVRSEAEAGKEFYEAADAHIRKELLHTFVTGLLHQRQMARVGVSRESLTMENILTANRQLDETFCTHVYSRMKKVIDLRPTQARQRPTTGYAFPLQASSCICL
ncbi:hypothetical protein J8I87_42190 [Paraburkholderia sp. LEh10]|uniref:hypothetical protein n=1 Tax=Paraburkholderia sp. LEh10 TaxID=2821353 RepID=UPI001AE313E8|nr:hypothetical protein [Paraburkholderia sp. LEh10]MBP0596108.1 hypothetical protein [Paraburkholderia sp. LEh10]